MSIPLSEGDLRYMVEERTSLNTPLRCIDLFCGLGGFRVAAESVCKEVGIATEWVFASDIDIDVQHAYASNFGDKPFGDITQIPVTEIPDHDVLFAGFPCQPFSICGDRKGFEDARGTLFFNIVDILAEKRPSLLLLENVKLLAGHDGGRTLKRIIEILEGLGYYVEYRVLNALHFGLPHKRERIFIAGFRKPMPFCWPLGNLPMRPLSEILEAEVSPFYHASGYIRQNRQEKFTGTLPNEPTIWHENKGGHISAYPYSCAMRAGASYNYLLVNGERRLTEREMLRLQGFPETYKIACSYTATRKQAGNSVPVPCVAAVFRAMLEAQFFVTNPSCYLRGKFDLKAI